MSQAQNETPKSSENWNQGQEPDPRPGHFYITANDGAKTFPIAGPFVDDHAAALSQVRAVMVAAGDRDGRAHFMSWGTTRMAETYAEPGPLNHVIGLDVSPVLVEKSRFMKFKQTHVLRIQRLVEEIHEVSDDLHWDLIDEMKGVFASYAANESGDNRDGQDSAIAQAESWVAAHCGDGDFANTVAMALWLKGVEAGETLLRSEKVERPRQAA